MHLSLIRAHHNNNIFTLEIMAVRQRMSKENDGKRIRPVGTVRIICKSISKTE